MSSPSTTPISVKIVARTASVHVAFDPTDDRRLKVRGWIDQLPQSV